jgi:hypothetical protein
MWYPLSAQGLLQCRGIGQCTADVPGLEPLAVQVQVVHDTSANTRHVERWELHQQAYPQTGKKDGKEVSRGSATTATGSAPSDHVAAVHNDALVADTRYTT